MRNERKPTGRPATYDVSLNRSRLIQALMSYSLAAGLFLTLAMVSPAAQAQMFLDEGDEVSGAGVSDSVTSSPRGKATSNQRKPQSKAAWSDKRKSHSQKQSKAVAKSQQKRASTKTAASSAPSKGSKTAKAAPVVKNSKSSASAPVANKVSNAKSGQKVAAVSPGRSPAKSQSPSAPKVATKAAAKSSAGKSRAPASASTFATTKKSCPLQVSPGAKENIGVTKFPRKLWVQDAGNPNYFKVVNREGREGFVKKSCFE
ncbi:MAG TPA: hypothetical protein PLZ57_01875 [Pseudobdellovibrionaceae bacterium]|nr:hypothetical protein [Pseudobdellovibrionaceae bacterium]